MKRLVFAKLTSFSLIFLMSLSCSDDPTYSKGTLYSMAKDWEEGEWRKMGYKDSEFEEARLAHSKFQLIIPKSPEEAVNCELYGMGPKCIAGFQVKLRKVVLTLVEMDSKKSAMELAKRIDQYYVRNWVLDDVTNEPVLEDFVTKVYNAKRGNPPKKK